MTRRKSTDIGFDLRQWMQHRGMTETELAAAVNSANPGRPKVRQPWISRICNGRFKRIAGHTAAVLKYANISTDGPKSADPKGLAVIDAAVDQVWDGSFESARAIARLLKEAASLSDGGRTTR